uniref:Uncharacterized protein n=2 Tax=Ditylenchus dipsaci TaxID=166011 RepID=A0A915D9H6_9BILA
MTAQPEKKPMIRKLGQLNKSFSFLATVDSREKLEQFRCTYQMTPRKFHSDDQKLVYRCLKCEFRIVALKDDNDQQSFHVYANGQHNPFKHQVVPIKNVKKVQTSPIKRVQHQQQVQSNENGCETFRMHGVVWSLTGLANNEAEVQQMRCAEQSEPKTMETQGFLQFRCRLRLRQEKCQFKMLAIRQDLDGKYKVYIRGAHNHLVAPIVPKDVRSSNKKLRLMNKRDSVARTSNLPATFKTPEFVSSSTDSDLDSDVSISSEEHKKKRPKRIFIPDSQDSTTPSTSRTSTQPNKPQAKISNNDPPNELFSAATIRKEFSSLDLEKLSMEKRIELKNLLTSLKLIINPKPRRCRKNSKPNPLPQKNATLTTSDPPPLSAPVSVTAIVVESPAEPIGPIVPEEQVTVANCNDTSLFPSSSGAQGSSQMSFNQRLSAQPPTSSLELPIIASAPPPRHTGDTTQQQPATFPAQFPMETLTNRGQFGSQLMKHNFLTHSSTYLPNFVICPSCGYGTMPDTSNNASNNWDFCARCNQQLQSFHMQPNSSLWK